MQSDVFKVALERGILSQEQAEALDRLSVEIAGKAETARDDIIAPRSDEPVRTRDHEDLKFVGGFGDIFVTIGLVLFLGAVVYFAGKIGGVLGSRDVEGIKASCLITAGATWLLAEYFTRKRRMALPSIVMLLVFISCCFVFFAVLFFGNTHETVDEIFKSSNSSAAQRWVVFGRVFATCIATAIMAVIYYWRFRVPIAVAGAVAVFGGVVIALISTILPDFVRQYARYIVLTYGLGVFALAMYFDMSDTLRRTRRTDIAFWLHLLAAPLVVHPLLNPIANANALTEERAVLIVAVFLLLGAIAIVIDSPGSGGRPRRSQLVSLRGVRWHFAPCGSF